MCSAHVGGATASQDGGSVTMHRHSPLAFANPSKNHSGFAHVGSDGLRRLTNKSKPGITCEHASLLLLHALKLPHVHSQNHPASRYAHAAFTACVLLIWGSAGFAGRWFCYHAQALPTCIRKSFVKNTQDLLMWGVTAYAAK